MKRWIHAAIEGERISRADAREFCSKVNTILNDELSNKYACELEAESAFGSYNYLDHFYLRMTYDTVCSDNISFFRNEYQRYGQAIMSSLIANDPQTAASNVVELIEKGVEDNEIVAPNDFDNFLSNYTQYLDAISNVVRRVASQYHSDMQWNWDDFDNYSKQQLVEYIVEFRKIWVSERDFKVTYALGMNVVSYASVTGFPSKYESKEETIVNSPISISYNGYPVNPSLDNFETDLKRLYVALEDYFKKVMHYMDPEKYPEVNLRHEGEGKAKQLKERSTSKRSKWSSVINKINKELESGIGDPLYESTDAGDYINSICSEVENKMGLYVEPSIQAGQGGVWIYDENDNSQTVLDNYDYQTFNDNIIDIALESKNMTEFKKSYKNYLNSIIE